MFKFFERITGWNRPDIMDVAREEVKKLSDVFFISRTAVELLDEVRGTSLPDAKKLPSVFEQVYDKHRKTKEEYDALDTQLEKARANSTGPMDYRRKAEELHYANCTSLASFVHEALKEKNIYSRIFGLGGEHHFVIAKENNSNEIVVIDPWIHYIFKMEIKEIFDNFEDLSGESRFDIARQYCQHTNLYPNLVADVERCLATESFRNKKRDEWYLKELFEISSTDRFFVFEKDKNENQNNLNI